MQLSTKARYSVRAMVYLAFHGLFSPVSVKKIAEEEGIPLNYLERLLSRMKKKKLVRSFRGKGGGYMLARKPEEISLAEIIKAAGENLYPTFCTQQNQRKICQRVENCAVYLVWRKLGDLIVSFLDKITLREVVEQLPQIKKRKEVLPDYTFYI